LLGTEGGSDERHGPDRPGSGQTAADHASVLPPRNQPGQRPGPRQDGPGIPASIAAVGLALAALPVVVERGVLDREFAPQVALRKLRFFADSPHGPEADATGYRGFYYHFLDMHTGRRAWQCELSTIDTALLLAGMLVCADYFHRDTPEEAEVRRLAYDLYARADWDWARDGGPAVTHGWRPETGFLPHRWTGYDEGLLLY